MQATLLIMCIFWGRRQHKLGIDDFGHPLHSGDERSYKESEALGGVGGPDADTDGEVTEGREDTPLLVKNGNGETGGKSWRVFRWMKGVSTCFYLVVLLSVELV